LQNVWSVANPAGANIFGVGLVTTVKAPA